MYGWLPSTLGLLVLHTTKYATIGKFCLSELDDQVFLPF
jgi:hypothetical protein